MTTRVTVAGHPIHPMLVTLPIGLWVFSLICDFVSLGSSDGRWASTAYLTLGGGVVGALIAAVPGLFDFLGLNDPRERRVATMHLVLNLAIVAFQGFNFWLRSQPEFDGSTVPLWISIVSVAVLAVSGWLGGQLVHVLGVTQPGHESSREDAASRERLHPRM
jgi:uncharacterized membrane protein